MKLKRIPDTRGEKRETKREKGPKEKSAIKIKSNIKAGPGMMIDP